MKRTWIGFGRSRAARPFARAAAWLALSGLLAVFIGCGLRFGTDAMRSAIATSPTLGSQAACTPTFPDEDGWLGGDAAASVVIPGSGGRASLWLFGDSFVARDGGGDAAQGDRAILRAYPFLHNSIAVSRCDAAGRWQIDYAWRARDTATPRAFFEPAPDADWVRRARREPGGDAYYWPISAASVGDAIWVALLRVVSADPEGPYRLPFRLVGVDLARLSDFEREPASWSLRHATLSRRTDAFPASSLVAVGDALYAFAFLDGRDERDGHAGHPPQILTRIPLDRLARVALPGERLPSSPLPSGPLPDGRDSLEDALETWSDDGRWLPGLAPDRARILMDEAATEMSVHFDPGLGEWLAVHAALPSETLRLRRAPQLTGPWSAPVPLFPIPELAGPRPDAQPGELFCYAGKAHPELAPSGALLVTWVCNVHAETAQEIPAVLERLRTTPSIYRPEARRIAVPPAVAPATPIGR